MAKYPAIRFVSTSVTKSNATSYAVTGNLTMHGVTKPVTLAVAASAPFKHAGGIRRGIEAITAVNRKDFGLVWDYPGEGPGSSSETTSRSPSTLNWCCKPNRAKPSNDLAALALPSLMR